MKEDQLFNTRPGTNWNELVREPLQWNKPSLSHAHSPSRALWPVRSVHTDGYGSRTQAEVITSPQGLGMRSQKLGVSREGKITHFRSRKSASLFGSLVRAGEEGNGGCQYEWLLKTPVNRPAMGALAGAQLAEGCPSSPGFGSLVLCQLFGGV